MENHQVEPENDKFAKFLREKETNMKTMNVIELFELVDEICRWRFDEFIFKLVIVRI